MFAEVPVERLGRMCLLLFAPFRSALEKSTFLPDVCSIFRWFSPVLLYGLLYVMYVWWEGVCRLSLTAALVFEVGMRQIEFHIRHLSATHPP